MKNKSNTYKPAAPEFLQSYLLIHSTPLNKYLTLYLAISADFACIVSFIMWYWYTNTKTLKWNARFAKDKIQIKSTCC